MNPKFTVVIPTFNAAATIDTAIRSVLMQSFSNFEVWVIDGGSGDSTVEIVAKHAATDPRVHFVSERDEGIYDAMNKGISRGSGEWFYFLGSDDSLHDYLVFESVVNEATRCSGAEMIYGNVLLSASIGFDNESLVFAGKFHGSRLLTVNICHQAIFYNRPLFEKFGVFNIRYRLLADWDFNLRCFNRIDPIYIETIVANFTAGASSAQAKDEAFLRDLLPNLVFNYPYKATHWIFKNGKEA